MKSICFHEGLQPLRDSEGKGLFGCLFFLVLLGAAIFLGIELVPIYYANVSLESDVKAEVSRAGAHSFDDETVSKDLLDLAKKNGITLTRENIKVDRFAGQVHITVHYTVPVDLVVLKHDFNFEIKASSFVGSL